MTLKIWQEFESLKLRSSNARHKSSRFGLGYDWKVNSHIHKHVKVACHHYDKFGHPSVKNKHKK